MQGVFPLLPYERVPCLGLALNQLSDAMSHRAIGEAREPHTQTAMKHLSSMAQQIHCMTQSMARWSSEGLSHHAMGGVGCGPALVSRCTYTREPSTRCTCTCRRRQDVDRVHVLMARVHGSRQSTYTQNPKTPHETHKVLNRKFRSMAHEKVRRHLLTVVQSKEACATVSFLLYMCAYKFAPETLGLESVPGVDASCRI